MFYGVSYYPEHKAPADLAYDLDLIKKSGINTVRMGEFAWCRFEPEEGVFHFDWLDRVVNELGEAGIKTVVCTPTACPPAWMAKKHPDMLYQDNRGVKRPFGGRRHYCYNNKAYREYSERIARQIGMRYGKNPFVAGFQIDNEPAQEGTGRCCCPVCREAFTMWLLDKYKTIEAFNKRSGGIFWSQEYTSFSQIQPPVNSIEVGASQKIRAFYENPTVRLEFERFSSDSQISYQDIQTRALKQFTDYPVTTNATGLATNSIDYYKSTKNLDCYAFDYYPGLRNASVDSFPYAFARGIKDGKPFWVLEFMSGGGHRLSGSGRLQPNPGALKQAVIQSFAHGAEMMLHFQYRSFPIGAEQLNYAIVDLDGIPRRRYYEMQETASLLKQLEPYQDARFVNEAAICVDYDTHWALRIKPVNDPDFYYLDYCSSIYHALAGCGVNADVISFDHGFDQYKLLVLPAAFLLKEKYREKLKHYVENGGTLVASFLTSVKNEDNLGFTETLPAGLTDVFGIQVEEVEPVFETNHTPLTLELKGRSIAAMDTYWSELLSGSAAMLGTYAWDYKKGQGVISKNNYGKGTAYYLGTSPDKEALHMLIDDICKSHGLFQNPIHAEEKVELIHRKKDGMNLYYCFNFTAKRTMLAFPGTMIDCISRKEYNGRHHLDPCGFCLLSESKSN